MEVKTAGKPLGIAVDLGSQPARVAVWSLENDTHMLPVEAYASADFRVQSDVVADWLWAKTPVAPVDALVSVFDAARRAAERALKEDVAACVVAAVAPCSDGHRQAIKNAAAAVGVNVLRVVRRSTAAIIALGLEREHANMSRHVVTIEFEACDAAVSVCLVEDEIIESLETVASCDSGANRFLE
ncbi:hypothetical protein P43SY_009349 [Pythium insidiosum]|uniref:Uncharacterized protein n=1 Tax=Pythium insidiosum TaxID=114742 RepID=A0AAD5Q7L5_PYTIN|nr:hypothetical protein P43SY_009349 [Pythium insidiosum]